MLFSNKDLRKIIIPIIIENFLSVTVGMADTLMVSNVGEAAVSAVSLVDSINVVIVCMFTALTTGGSVVTSQYLGKKDEEMARFSSKQLILSSFSLATIIAVIVVFLKGGILNLIFGHVEVSILEFAKTYFLVTALSYPFLALFNSTSAIFRAMGKSSISLLCGFTMNIVNIGLNAVFIFGMNMGVFGAALATLIGRATAAIIGIVMLKNRNNILYVDSYLDMKPDMEIIKKILKIGVPSGIENSAFQFGKLLVQRIVTSFGSASIAAYAITNSVGQIQVISSAALGISMLPIVGRCIGADEYEQAKYYVKRLMIDCYIIMFVLGVATLLALPFVISLYNVSLEAKELATTCIKIHVIGAMIIHPFAFSFSNVLRAAGDARYPLVVSTISMFTFRVGFGYLFGTILGFGLVGIYIGNVFDWFCRATSFIARYCSGKWMNRKIV